MKLLKLRLGLATNSSSTHSLIFLSPDQLKGLRDTADGQFGWDFFTATSSGMKDIYTAVILRRALDEFVPEDAAVIIVKDWTGVDLSKEDAYIDHQSMYTLPSAFGLRAGFPDREFFNDLRQYMLQEDLVILGGNDNTGDNHPLSNDGEDNFTLPFPQESYTAGTVCRKDPKYGYWTLFNQSNGTKIRFDFGNRKQNIPDKASTPELVDLKITGYCNSNCEYCYQDSTAYGKHAEYRDISNIVRVLAEMKCFEIAIGGGEPTQHPDFIRILESIRLNGIVPNFTTKDLRWLRDDVERNAILDACGAFAYSPGKRGDVERLGIALRYHGVSYNKASVQIVMGTQGRWEFERTLTEAKEYNLRVTLLGYKEIGRGKDFKPEDYSWWLDVIKSLTEMRKCPQVGIDTALAAEYETELEEAEIDSWMFSVKEGTHSMYIDAVGKKAGPSSYCPEDQMKPIEISDSYWKRNIKPNELSELFQSF